MSKDYNTEILVASEEIIDFFSTPPVAVEQELIPAIRLEENIAEFEDSLGIEEDDGTIKEGVHKEVPDGWVRGERTTTVLPKIDFKNVKVRQYLNKDCSGEGLGIFPESSVRCFNFLANQAAADFVVVAVDDHMITGDLAGLLNTLTVENGTLSPFYNKKYKIGTLKGYPGSSSTCPGTRSYKEEERTHCESYVCCWPIFHKSVLDEFGGVLFNQTFYHHYCDNWISYWIFKGGESIPIFHDLQMHKREDLVNERNPGYEDLMFRTLVEHQNQGNNDYNMHLTKPIELTIMPYSFRAAGGLIRSPFGPQDDVNR